MNRKLSKTPNRSQAQQAETLTARLARLEADTARTREQIAAADVRDLKREAASYRSTLAKQYLDSWRVVSAQDLLSDVWIGWLCGTICESAQALQPAADARAMLRQPLTELARHDLHIAAGFLLQLAHEHPHHENAVLLPLPAPLPTRREQEGQAGQ